MFSTVPLIAAGLLALFNGIAAGGPSPVPLGTTANYAILAQTGVSTVPASAITGDIGVSPAAGTFLTGFSLTLDASGTYSTSAQVTGKLTGASYDAPTPAVLTAAIGDLGTAYSNATSREGPDFTNLYGGDLAGQTLLPGLYKWTGAVGATQDFTISGSASDTWIFQIDGTLVIDGGKKVVLAGGARARNIVWVVAGATSLEAASHFEGIILGKTAVTFKTGSSINGRILAQTGVALQQATVVVPA